jgi:predicted small lipoprotein YifL
VKSHISPARLAVLLATAAPLLMLAGCGQKGPLYMPRVPPDPLAQTAPKPATSKSDAAGVAASDAGATQSKPAAGDK